MLPKFVLAALVSASLTASVQAQSLLEWKRLVPGPFAVGFRVTVVSDPTRTIYRPTDYFGRARPNAGQRPLQVAVWYPAAAKAGGVAMTYGDYIPLLAWDPGMSRDTEAQRREAALKYIQTVTPQAGPPVATEIARIFGQRVLARQGADPAPGRFPVLLYAPGYGYPAFDNSVMFEYLASHGYVVVASPSVGLDGKRMTGDAHGLEAQTRDLEFLAGHVRTWPQVDAEKLGAAGFSWGGLSSMLFTLRHSGVRALISLDSVIRQGPAVALAKTFPHFTPARLRVPTLEVTCTPDQALPGMDDSSFLAEVKYADITTAVVPGVQHHDLASMSNLLRRAAQPSQGKDWAAATTGYEALCRLVLGFLDAHLEGIVPAGQAASAATASGVVVSLRKAEKTPPSRDDFLATLDSDGPARAADLVRATRRDHPTALPALEAVVNEAGYELLFGGRARDAVVVLAAGVECFPESLNALDSLGEAYLAAGELDKAEKCYLNVRRKLEKAENLSPAARAQYETSVETALTRIEKLREK